MLYQRGSAAAYELVSMDAGDEPGPSGSSADTTITGSGGHKRPRRHSKASTRKHSKAAAGGTVGQQAYQNLQMADDEYDDNSNRQPTEQSPSRDRIYHHHRHSNQYRGTSAGDLLDELELRELDDRLGEMVSVGAHGRGRRNRREGLFGTTFAGSIPFSGESWDSSELLASNSALRETLAELAGDELRGSEGSSPRGKERDDESRGIKKYARLILPHVALVLLTCAYTMIGAIIFYSVENPNETSTKRNQLNLIYKRQDQFLDDLLQLASRNRSAVSTEDWENLARAHLHDMSDILFIAFEKNFLTSTEVRKNATLEIWTLSTAVFFSVTVVTTIGYGNPVPGTQVGRMACVIFSLFGIPLTLVTIADLGKFLSEHLIWVYGKYRQLKGFIFRRWFQSVLLGESNTERVCSGCQGRGLTEQMLIPDESRIPALIVLSILVLYTALGGLLMSKLESWTFFTSFYWSFITMTTVGFGDLMPRRDHYTYLILLYIVLGLAITTMCIDLVGVQYIRKIHYFGRKIQDARSALAVVGGKVVLVSELYTNLMQKRQKNSVRDSFVIDNLYIAKHIIPFVPNDIRKIRYIDQLDPPSRSSSLLSLDLCRSCRFCHHSNSGISATANTGPVANSAQ